MLGNLTAKLPPIYADSFAALALIEVKAQLVGPRFSQSTLRAIPRRESRFPRRSASRLSANHPLFGNFRP
tara:strand:- start:6644 stop:6853 length:210 start_codon:yes stop_codon:yes gene_type:complete